MWLRNMVEDPSNIELDKLERRIRIQLNMSWRVYIGGIMAYYLFLYLYPRDGADIPKRGRGDGFQGFKPFERSSSPGKEYRHSCDAALNMYFTSR